VQDWTAEEAAAQYLAYGITVAEGSHDSVPVKEFRAARDRMLKDPVARKLAPAFIARCSSPELLWGYLRSKATGSGSWGIRRGVMHEAVDPILDALAGATVGPTDDLVAGAIERLNAESVRMAWTRAVERRDTDPDGAVTAARALLESTLKTILDDRGEAYKEGDDLPKLYGRVQKVLKLSPAEQTEDRFRAILGACATVVKELGSVRNRHSDAHGAGRRKYRVAGRHAALAVNLAGSMALFLIETHEARSEQE
jgi:hypothetical protein